MKLFSEKILLSKIVTVTTFYSVFISVITVIVSINPVSALSGSQFNAGNIIDDAIFYNSSSMSPQEIQNFLNSKVPVCDTNGVQPYAGTTRAAYSASRGYPAPYTCLKDYSQTIPNITNSGSDLCKGSITGGQKSAALLIYDVSQACGINPQVLIVMLQKEQSLVTDDWPWSIQYNTAMGYACPDSGPNNSANCDSEFFGFFNQVYNAAKAFRRYEANPNSYNYKANRNNNILYNPNTGCGSSNVFIENQATASLYIYTPYQPNAAALNNLYGTGDSCSAYGNRNFWRMFNDWFGSTHGSVHSWELKTQYAFTDISKSTAVNLQNVRPGQRVYVGLTAKNVGNVTWGNSGQHPVVLGTTGPPDRISSFCDSTWLSCNRPAVLKQALVAPGETGTFEFWVKIPNKTDKYIENFSLLVENHKWMNDVGMNYSFRASSGIQNDWSANGIDFYTDSSKKSKVNSAQLKAGSNVYVNLKLKNNGINDWVNDNATPIRIGTSSPQDNSSVFCHTSWSSCNRVARMKEAKIDTGQTGTFEFWYKVPSKLGKYNQKYMPLEEGVAWMPIDEISLYLNVTHGNYSWKIDRQYAYTDQTKTTPVSISNLAPGQKVYLVFTAKNTGLTTWSRGVNAPNAGTNAPHDRKSNFCTTGWINCTRPSSMNENEVKPGEIATYEFWYQAPYKSGAFTEHFKLVVDGYSWLNENSMNFKTTVTNPVTTWQLKSMYAFTDSSKSTPVDLTSLSPDQRVFIGFTAKNSGNSYWNRSGSNPIRVGTNAPHDRKSLFCDSTWITCARPGFLKEGTIAPGETGTFEFWYKAPNKTGNYTEHFKLLSEGLYWLNENALNFYTEVK